jgi:anti-sigma28 factor (negative regulator of flagellin synthesis)
MNIQSINAVYGLNSYEASKRSEQKTVPAQSNTIKGERVEISAESSQLHELRDVVDNLPEVRIALVERIKTRIKNNDYPLENNLDDVVKKMIEGNILKPY